jgi:hypothetical protein
MPKKHRPNPPPEPKPLEPPEPEPPRRKPLAKMTLAERMAWVRSFRDAQRAVVRKNDDEED